MNIRETREFLEFGFNVVICPVCGEETLDNNFICPHCGWEHDENVQTLDQISSANESSIDDYKIATSENSL